MNEQTTTTDETTARLARGTEWSTCVECGEVIYPASSHVAGWRHKLLALHGATPDTAADFFYVHAGYSWHGETETEETGHRRCARQLADAERAAHQRCWSIAWEADWQVGSHVREFPDAYEEEPETCETALLLDEDGDPIGVLGCVDDATDEYRRVIFAELAADALAEINAHEETSNVEEGMGDEMASNPGETRDEPTYPWLGGARWTPEAFDIAFTSAVTGDPYEVPADIRRAAERVVIAYGLRGVCDPIYVANVIAKELGRGDGESRFFAPDDNTCEGFTNYETAAVAIVVDNDQPRILAVRDAVRVWLRDAAKVDPGYVEEVRGAALVAVRLRGMWEEMAPELDAEWSSLLSASLESVNWYELACHWIADVAETDAADEEGK